MKLYYFPVAPNPTKVRVYLAEKGLQLETERVDLRAAQQRTPEFLSKNPLGKLPVLELDDGRFFTESLAIIEYLEELYPDPPLIGASPEERMRVRELERLAELGVLVPVARIVHATNSPIGAPLEPAVAESARSVLPDGLRVLDDTLADGRPFIAGERPTIADCTLAAALQFGRFRYVTVDPAFENVVAWDERYRARPPAKTTLIV